MYLTGENMDYVNYVEYLKKHDILNAQGENKNENI